MSRQYWAICKKWRPSILSGAAQVLGAQGQQVQECASDVLAVRPPIWVGRAANVAKLDRENASHRIDVAGRTMGHLGTAVGTAASGIAEIQADMARTESSFAKVGMAITPAGGIVELPGPYLERIGRIEALLTVLLLGARAKSVDQTLAGELTRLASSMDERRDKADYFDYANSYTAKFATTGLDWDFSWRDQYMDLPWTDIMGEVPEDFFEKYLGDGFSKLFREMRDDLVPIIVAATAKTSLGESQMPVWMQRYLQDGRVPSGVELAENYLFYQAGRFEFEGLVKRILRKTAKVDIPKNLEPSLFQDWNPYKPQPSDVTHVRTTDAPPARDLADVGESAENIYEFSRKAKRGERGSLEVRIIEGTPPRILVVLPGTSLALSDPNGWTGDERGTDWPANVKLAGQGTSSAMESAAAAIDLAVREYEKQPGAQSLEGAKMALAGHSQGGLLAASLAADKSFSGRYDVETVFAMGAPIDNVPISPDVHVVSVANANDSVPRLDLNPPTPPNVQHVEFRDEDYPDTGPPEARDMMLWHSEVTYRDRVKLAAQPGGPLADYDAYMRGFLDGEQHHLRVKFGRDRGF